MVLDNTKNLTKLVSSNLDENYLNDWNTIVSELRHDFKSIIWNSWISPLKFLSLEKESLNILVPSELVRNRIESQYYEQLYVKSQKFFPSLKKINFVTDQNSKVNKTKEYTNNIPKIKKHFSISFISNVSESLNKNFKFKSFITDETNELAFFASKKVAKNISRDYNPLVIYGGVGLGKTHLANSIAWEIKKENNRKFAYMSAERFMYQFIRSLKLKETLSFKEQFRSIDFLIIDDLQFIGGKESTQQEFFHLFNDLIDAKKQIIITADKSPHDLLDLDYKLKSRLSGGLVVDIMPTTYDLRVKIIKDKLLHKQFYLEKDIINFLADKFTKNVRELEGAINKILAYSDLMKTHVDLIKVKNILNDQIRSNFKKINIQDIQLEVSKYFNINFSELCSKNRSRFISRPRQIAMYLSKELTPHSYPEIGKCFNGKDHATVIHAVNKIKQLYAEEKKIKLDIDNLNMSLKS